jgi:cation-transporting ATPase 13A1
MFHPALFISLVGQFVVHLGCMIYAVRLAKEYMPNYEEVKKPTYAKFTPNLINTVVFLVQTMQQVSVLMVNYKGRPFQPSLTESKGTPLCLCPPFSAFHLVLRFAPIYFLRGICSCFCSRRLSPSYSVDDT